MTSFLPEGKRIDTVENANALSSFEQMRTAMERGDILEARAVLCDHDHNLKVDLPCMRGVIPREEGALGIREGSVRDIAVISRVNRPVCFIVTDITVSSDGSPLAVLSREKAQRMCMDGYISTLRAGDVADARVTHLEAFGAFADIGCGVAALMPIDAISVSRIEHPRERFTVGMDIRAVIKSVENGRISLSHKELLGTWEQNAESFTQGETVTGIIRSVESYGSFVELTPNLAGLAESHPAAEIGMQASVYIKSIIPKKMKIKLIIIDTFDAPAAVTTPRYYFTGSHMDRFTYPPAESTRLVETRFGEASR